MKPTRRPTSTGRALAAEEHGDDDGDPDIIIVIDGYAPLAYLPGLYRTSWARVPVPTVVVVVLVEHR